MQFSRPDVDATALIRSSAIGTIAAISPYRHALFRLHRYLNGFESDRVQVRAAIDDALTANWTADDPVERSALLNISAIMSLLEDDISRAQRDVELTQSVIASTPSVITAFSMNAAFVSILSGNLEDARRHIESTLVRRGQTIAIRGFDAYVQVQRGLIAWAEGNLEDAFSIMQAAHAADPNNRNARIYVAWLRHLRSGATGRFDPLNMSDQVARYHVVPQLMVSAFLLDPQTREILRVPASMDRR